MGKDIWTTIGEIGAKLLSILEGDKEGR